MRDRIKSFRFLKIFAWTSGMIQCLPFSIDKGSNVASSPGPTHLMKGGPGNVSTHFVFHRINLLFSLFIHSNDV